jgi:predicted phage tail protein
MKIILHGVLAEQFGREFRVQTNVPADAIEGLSRQLPNWPRDLVIDVVDFDTEAKLRAQTDVDEIHLVPRMYGGGGKWFNIIVGVALIAASFLLPVVGIAAGITLNAIMFSVGASFLMMGVSQMFMKAPTIDKAADPPPSKYLGNTKNTAAIGTPIAMAWGRIKLSGHWLSIQVDSSALITTNFPVTTS